MPYIVKGEPTYSESTYDKVSYDYDYPNGLNLKPGSKLHDKLRDKIWEMARMSKAEMSKRYDAWREMDRVMTVYMPLKDSEQMVKDEDKDKPVSIVFPYTYSMMEALLTYLVMAFFQDPIFQYEGVEADDTAGAMLLELVVKMHCIKNKVPLALHTVLRDSLGYGAGIGLPTWITKYGSRAIRSKIVTDVETYDDVQFVDDLLFEGNGLDNVDPYLWLPDPSVSSSNIQEGEFFGWIDRGNYMNLLREESNPDTSYFNVKYLKHKKDKRSTLAYDTSDRETKHGGSTESHRGMTGITNPVDQINMYVTLIPKDWGLGDGEYPEKWLFTLAADDLIIRCERAEYHHGMYPAAVASPEFDGYSIAPIGRMEVLYGLQHTLDFLFNSHIQNVRKAINDMLIVDPYLVNINDLKNPKPGKIIRLRRPAWGRGVDKVVQQLMVQDITRLNIADSSYITQWMDRISGADQSMMGSIRQGGPERLTKGEFQGTRGSAISRLQRIAMIISLQFMQDIGTMFAAHTQQYMSKETYVKITGKYAEQLSQTFGPDRVKVAPYDIAINYDLIVRDGSIPGGNFSDVWVKMFETIGGSPELMQQFDITKIFTYIAHELGAKNVEDFKRNANRIAPNVMPDEEVMNQVGKGNLVPIGGA